MQGCEKMTRTLSVRIPEPYNANPMKERRERENCRRFGVFNTRGIIICIELCYDDLYNEPAVCSYTNLIQSGRY